MVNYFENDYALPIILGSCKESIDVAKEIQRRTSLDVTVISHKLSFLNKIRFQHLPLTSKQEEIILLALTDYARDAREYSTPILIFCEEHDAEFIEKYRPELEHIYVIIPSREIKFYLGSNE